jgi:hypothetical protein
LSPIRSCVEFSSFFIYFIFIFNLLSHSPPYSSGGDNVMMVFRACGW